MPTSKESRERLGRALTKAREDQGLSVVELAQRSSPGRSGGLSRYYDAEAGRRMATSETVEHYAKALGRPDLHDVRDKLLSTRPGGGRTRAGRSGVNRRAAATRRALAGPDADHGSDHDADQQHRASEATDDEPPATPEVGNVDLTYSIPNPTLLPDSLIQPLERMIASAPPLHDGTVIRGRSEVLAATLALLEEALERQSSGEQVSIKVIQPGRAHTFTRGLPSSDTALRTVFPFQLQRLLKAGATVHHLLGREILLSLDPWAAFERFIAMMELAGDYLLFVPGGNKDAGRTPDYLVIEGVAVLEILPTDPLTWAGDAAIVHRRPEGARSVIAEYCDNLMAEAEAAFTVIDPSSQLAAEEGRVMVDRTIINLEDAGGPRLLLKYGLSTLSEPLKPYERRLIESHDLLPNDRSHWPPWIKEDLDIRRRRLANFRKQIEHHRTVELIPRSALEHYVAHGKYSTDCADFGDYEVPVGERLQHLEDLLTLITTNKLYDLIVVDDDPPLTSLAGTGLLMMGDPTSSSGKWSLFYESTKPGPDSGLICVAFETQFELLREPVGVRIGSLANLATEHTTHESLRLLRDLIDSLRKQI